MPIDHLTATDYNADPSFQNSGPLTSMPVDRIRKVANPMREKESPKDGGGMPA